MATYASIKYDMDLSSNATGAGGMTLLSTQTASSDSTIDFTSGIDSTYNEYVFKYINIHASADDDAEMGYQTGSDLAQSTAFQIIHEEVGNDNDSSTSGEMWLFNPSSTTYVKHFIAKTECSWRSNRASTHFVAGYCNVTAAIDAVQFKFASGNIDSGTIKLYGIA